MLQTEALSPKSHPLQRAPTLHKAEWPPSLFAVVPYSIGSQQVSLATKTVDAHIVRRRSWLAFFADVKPQARNSFEFSIFPRREFPFAGAQSKCNDTHDKPKPTPSVTLVCRVSFVRASIRRVSNRFIPSTPHPPPPRTGDLILKTFAMRFNKINGLY